MKLYLFIINLAMLLIALVNIIAKTAAPLYGYAALPHRKCTADRSARGTCQSAIEHSPHHRPTKQHAPAANAFTPITAQERAGWHRATLTTALLFLRKIHTDTNKTLTFVC